MDLNYGTGLELKPDELFVAFFHILLSDFSLFSSDVYSDVSDDSYSEAKLAELEINWSSFLPQATWEGKEAF